MGRNIYDRTRLENQIKDFKTRGIVKENGAIDIEKYQAWFIRYFSMEQAKSIRQKIEIIEEANYITKEACRDLRVKEDYIPKDGGMNEEKITQLILSSVSKDQVKKELKEIIAQVVGEKKEDKPLDEEEKDPSSQEETNENKDETDDEKLYKACFILLPLIRKAQLDNDLNLEETNEHPEEEYIHLLEEQGFNHQQIARVLDTVTRDTLEVEKEKRKNEETKYNAYNDWRFIYYMSCLGKGFSIYYDPKALTLAQVIAKSLQQDTQKQERVNTISEEHQYLPKEASEETKKQLEDTFLLDVIAFRSKYDVDINRLELITDFFNAQTAEDFQRTYKNYVKNYYEQGKEHVTDLPEFMKAFDKLVKSTCMYMNSNKFVQYGGMTGEEIYAFCWNMREEDCNLTRQLEQEVVRQFGRIENIDGRILMGYLESKVYDIDQEDGTKEERQDLMRDAMASYLLLKDIHEKRTRLYCVRHPINYVNEGRCVARMKEVMDRQLNHVQEEEVQEFREFERRRTVYRRGFEEENVRLRTFSMNVEQEHERSISRQQIDVLEDIVPEEEHRDLLQDEDYVVIQQENAVESEMENANQD